MKYLLLPLLLTISSLSLADYNSAGYLNKETNYFYAKGALYMVSDDKAYKVELIDGEYLTTNEWIPTKRSGYTDEYVKEIKELQKERQRVIQYANQSLKRIKGY